MVSNKQFQKRKIKAEGRLQRREQQKLATVNILIVGEGATEYNYFNDMQRNFRGMGINIILRKPTGSAPISIVDTAINYSEKNEDVDYAFCVFDRDEHTTFDAALDKLRRYRPSLSAKSKPVFKAITSEPCFEIWLLLHFTFSTKSYSRSGTRSPADSAYDDLLKEFPEYSKTMTNLYSELNLKLNTAVTNSKKLSTYNAKINNSNPSTNMHELIDFVRQKLGI